VCDVDARHLERAKQAASGKVAAYRDFRELIARDDIYGPARLYRNDAPRHGRWLLLRVIGSNRITHGATVTVRADGREHVRTVSPGCSYLSSNDPRVHFGLGEVSAVDEITVRWPDGTRERFPGTEPDRILEIQRGQGTVIP
jgi:hypothetical protein